MDDLISRKKALGLARDLIIDNKDGTVYRYRCIDPDALAELSIEGTERKMGKWEVLDIRDYAQRPTGRKIGRCPFCGHITGEFRRLLESHHALTNFCPNCGAKLEGE